MQVVILHKNLNQKISFLYIMTNSAHRAREWAAKKKRGFSTPPNFGATANFYCTIIHQGGKFSLIHYP
jgi:hypothetical protein